MNWQKVDSSVLTAWDFHVHNEDVIAATITGHVMAVHPSRIYLLYKSAKENGEECFYTYYMPMPPYPSSNAAGDGVTKGKE
jgi:hypothetical protein